MNIGFNKYFTNYIIKDLYTDTHIINLKCI